ncbi:hypothetical protein EDC45_0079 [Mesocricetibacter intestinalis]|uniref:tRNA-modifying protein YgfZ-like beta-barrel domain-containing protein n=1 Tax=Mesocricetibacter intestinalis TaxID=1521930 RepID=A0A4R6VF03_9PAST|nr:folate-binding protein [Mesocricetibacter intestinalis]TDQ59432.1 hypothetical protein EDC45_0079 [Mesocricetibacter intestinalis]
MNELIALPQYRLLEICGPEAQTYLQGQLTCDLNQLPVGSSTLCAHCDPKGKVGALLRLYHAREQCFYALVRADSAPHALAQLKKYAIFSKVEIRPLETEIAAAPTAKCTEINAEFYINLGAYSLLLNPQQAAAQNRSDEWDCWEIQQGYPLLSAELQNQFIPQALNLQALEQAISFRKGCYIGQETVARAQFRGANKRAMFTFTSSGGQCPSPGSELEIALENGWRKTGSVLSAICQGDTLWLQAVLNRWEGETPQFRLPEQQTALELYPLPYDL